MRCPATFLRACGKRCSSVLEKASERTHARHRRRAPDAGWGVRDDGRSGNRPASRLTQTTWRRAVPLLLTGYCRRRPRRHRRLATDARSRFRPAQRRAVCSALFGRCRATGHRRRPPRPCDFSPRDASRVLGGRQAAPARVGPLGRWQLPIRGTESCARTVLFAGRSVDWVSAAAVNSSECPSAAGAPIALGHRGKPVGCQLGHRWSDPVRPGFGAASGRYLRPGARRRS